MTEANTINLGVLFREAKKGQPVDNTHRKEPKKKRTLQTTGIEGVVKIHNKTYKRGYFFKYQYIDDDLKKRSLQSVNFMTLYKKMMKKNFAFNIESKLKAAKFLKNNCNKEDYTFLYNKYIKED